MQLFFFSLTSANTSVLGYVLEEGVKYRVLLRVVCQMLRGES